MGGILADSMSEITHFLRTQSWLTNSQGPGKNHHHAGEHCQREASTKVKVPHDPHCGKRRPGVSVDKRDRREGVYRQGE